MSGSITIYSNEYPPDTDSNTVDLIFHLLNHARVRGEICSRGIRHMLQNPETGPTVGVSHQLTHNLLDSNSPCIFKFNSEIIC